MPRVSAVLRQAAVAAAEHAGDEPLLELVDGVVELDAAVDHLLDELVEPVADHDHVELPAGQAAERLDVLLARLRDDVVGQRGHRRLLVPLDLLEVVAHELLVEARLRRRPGV